MTPIERGLKLAREGKVTLEDIGNKGKYYSVTNIKGVKYEVVLKPQQIWECTCEHASRYCDRGLCCHIYSVIFYKMLVTGKIRY